MQPLNQVLFKFLKFYKRHILVADFCLFSLETSSKHARYVGQHVYMAGL